MATAKQLKPPIPARRASPGPRRKRTRSEPRQYTVADLERARDRVAAAERRIRKRPDEQSRQGTRGVGTGTVRTAHHRVAITVAQAP